MVNRAVVRLWLPKKNVWCNSHFYWRKHLLFDWSVPRADKVVVVLSYSIIFGYVGDVGCTIYIINLGFICVVIWVWWIVPCKWYVYVILKGTNCVRCKVENGCGGLLWLYWIEGILFGLSTKKLMICCKWFSMPCNCRLVIMLYLIMYLILWMETRLTLFDALNRYSNFYDCGACLVHWCHNLWFDTSCVAFDVWLMLIHSSMSYVSRWFENDVPLGGFSM